MSTHDFEIVDDWSVGQGQDPNSPIIVRIRGKLNSINGRKNYPHMMRIIWAFDSISNLGMPSKSESDKLSKFEENLIDCFENDYHSILTIVLTKSGFREWHFYTKNIDEFMTRLGSIPHDNGNAVEVYFTEDENWESYEKMREKM